MHGTMNIKKTDKDILLLRCNVLQPKKQT